MLLSPAPVRLDAEYVARPPASRGRYGLEEISIALARALSGAGLLDSAWPQLHWSVMSSTWRQGGQHALGAVPLGGEPRAGCKIGGRPKAEDLLSRRRGKLE
jgi:hypothetical protein